MPTMHHDDRHSSESYLNFDHILSKPEEALNIFNASNHFITAEMEEFANLRLSRYELEGERFDLHNYT
jgi:hypothetical protein